MTSPTQSEERKMKKNTIKIEEMTVLHFGHRENAERNALALCSSGYFAQIVNTSGSYLVYVYKRKI